MQLQIIHHWALGMFFVNEHAFAIPPAPKEELAGPLPTVSVVVPVHKWDQAFRQCLQGLLKLQPSPLEIIISSDGEVAGLADLEGIERLTINTNPVPGGPAAARNAGAALATGDILLFLDSDVVAPGDIVLRVARHFHAQPAMDALIGSYDDEPPEPNFLSQYKNLAHHWVHQHAHVQASSFWTGCGALRREVFDRLGGFDQSYQRPCIEDIEFGYRLKEHGGDIRIDKHLQVKHLKQWSAASLLRTDFLDRAIPWSELILERGRFINDLNLTYANRLSVAMSLLLALALPAGLLFPGALWAAAAAFVCLILLNAGLLAFLMRKRGLWFALKVLPWHWFQFVYSGVAFGWVWMRLWLKRIIGHPPGSASSYGPLPAQPTVKPLAGSEFVELVSVIVPAYNARNTIRDCLDSLGAQEGGHALQVIVVDSSQDQTAQIVADEFPWVELLRHSRRKHPGEARNLGLAAAKGSIVSFIDADCRAHLGWVGGLLRAHAMGRPVVGGSVAMANPASLTGRAYYYCLFSPWLDNGPPRWVSDQPTANISFEREALDRLGPFRSRGLCSDSEMQWRMAGRGLRTWFDPSIKVRHHNPTEMDRLVGHRFKHGKAHARLRAEYWQWSRGRRLAYAALSPLIMVKLLIGRLAKILRRPARLSDLLPCLPLLVLGLFCWSVGEAQGYGQAGDEA